MAVTIASPATATVPVALSSAAFVPIQLSICYEMELNIIPAAIGSTVVKFCDSSGKNSDGGELHGATVLMQAGDAARASRSLGLPTERCVRAEAHGSCDKPTGTRGCCHAGGFAQI